MNNGAPKKTLNGVGGRADKE